MKNFYLTLLFLGITSTVTVQAQNAAVTYFNYHNYLNSAAATEDTGDDEFSDTDEDEEEDTDTLSIQERLEKARQEEAEAQIQPPQPPEEPGGLTRAQKNKLKNESADIKSTAPAPSVKKKESTGDRYDKPKHDWSFKDPNKSESVSVDGSSTSPDPDKYNTMKKY